MTFIQLDGFIPSRLMHSAATTRIQCATRHWETASGLNELTVLLHTAAKKVALQRPTCVPYGNEQTTQHVISRTIARQTGHTRQSAILPVTLQSIHWFKKGFSTKFSNKCVVK